MKKKEIIFCRGCGTLKEDDPFEDDDYEEEYYNDGKWFHGKYSNGDYLHFCPDCRNTYTVR